MSRFDYVDDRERQADLREIAIERLEEGRNAMTADTSKSLDLQAHPEVGASPAASKDGKAKHDAAWDRLAHAIGDIAERPRSLSAQTELASAVSELGTVTKTLLAHVATLTAKLEAERERADSEEQAKLSERTAHSIAVERLKKIAADNHAMATRETARADAAVAEAKALREVETGWLIERGDSEVCAPLYWGGVHGWTTDNLKAIRYARREDAQAEADWSESEATYKARIAEHQWVPARATLAQPAAS